MVMCTVGSSSLTAVVGAPQCARSVRPRELEINSGFMSNNTGERDSPGRRRRRFPVVQLKEAQSKVRVLYLEPK